MLHPDDDCEDTFLWSDIKCESGSNDDCLRYEIYVEHREFNPQSIPHQDNQIRQENRGTHSKCQKYRKKIGCFAGRCQDGCRFLEN